MATLMLPNSRANRRLPKKALHALDAALNAKLISKEAIQTIVNLADPFPDGPVEPSGWPDVDANGTFPEVIDSIGNISAPVGTVNSWNFKVIIIPFVCYKNVHPATISAPLDVAVAPSPAGHRLGSYNLYMWKDSDPEPDITAAPNISWYEATSALDAQVRKCSQGVEIINTSAEISRGGMYYAARFPFTFYQTAPLTVTNAFNPPANRVHTPLAFAGWPTLDGIRNLRTRVENSAYHGFAFVNTPMNPMNDFVVSRLSRLLAYQGTKALLETNAGESTDFQWCGGAIYFTGLDPKATFTYKSRSYYEISPNETSTKQLQSIARHSVEYSPLALEIIGGVLSDLPAGFDYSMNPFGEWFDKVINLIGNVAPVIGSVLPIPGANLIGQGIGAVARGISSARLPAQPTPSRAVLAPVRRAPAVRPKRTGVAQRRQTARAKRA